MSSKIWVNLVDERNTENDNCIYDDVPSDKCMALRCGAEHGIMLYSGDGYVTAWFMYWLKGNEEAGKAFFGDNAEILNNSCWQDINKSF